MKNCTSREMNDREERIGDATGMVKSAGTCLSSSVGTCHTLLAMPATVAI